MSTDRPKQLGLSAGQLSQATDEVRAVVAAAIAGIVDQNLDGKFDPKIAALAAGEQSQDLYKYAGIEWLEMLIYWCRLEPQHQILDIGCGAGRMAFPISMYLNSNGRYYGFDPVLQSIEFCNQYILKPNFKFAHIDLRHYLYNPSGTIDSSSFRFPYDDRTFDAALAASVFTHLDLPTATNYLRESRRVLRIGGRALFSFFAVEKDDSVPAESVSRLLGKGEGIYSFRFLHRGDGFYTHSDEWGAPKNHYVPDSIGDPVAFDLDAFIALCEQTGFHVEKFLPGAWCRDSYVYGYQDAVVLRAAD